MIVTPCPLCQANVEVYQSEINKKQGTKFHMPVVCYSPLMTVAYGGSAKDAALVGRRFAVSPAPTSFRHLPNARLVVSCCGLSLR